MRYFVVVAELLNFARAAAARHVAQPSLSRQIQRLEDALGVRLLERIHQGSRLSAAGAAFLPQAQTLLHTAHQAVLTARAAAPPRTVTIGYVEDLVITPAVRDLRRRPPMSTSAPVTWIGTRPAPCPRAGSTRSSSARRSRSRATVWT